MTSAPRPSTALTDEEAHREAVRLTGLLERAGQRDGDGKNWWNHVAHKELGGRTATRAWLDGDYELVRDLIERFVSRRAAEALARNPGAVRGLLRQSS
jgi:hypothetical protein